MPKVSICIPNYNYGKYIGDTIQSILNQTYKNFELIIVDDASTDNSIEVINSFNDPRISVYVNECNIGITANWNRCLGYVTGEYIAIFHSDDIYHREIIEHEVNLLSSKNVHIAGTRATSDITMLPKKIKMKYSIYPPSEFIKFLFVGNTLVCPSVMIKKECYEDIGEYREDLFFVEDLEFHLRATVKYGFAKIENILMFYRQQQQTEKSWASAFNGQLSAYKKRIEEYKILKKTAKGIFRLYPNQKEIKDYYMNFIAWQDINIGRRYQLMNMQEEAASYFASARWIQSQIKEDIPRIIPDTIGE